MKSFLQSLEWEKFQESVGRNVFWIEKKLVIKHDLPLGSSYFYCPRPDFRNVEEFKKFATEVKKNAKTENAIFAKIEPNKKLIIDNSIIDNLIKIDNCKLKISENLQPQNTLLLDLNQNESAILANMHPKTRYNIRLAEKHKIKITHSTNVKDIEIFYQLAIKTSSRDKFSYHPKEYYQKMMEILGKNEMVKLYLAEYKIQDTKYIPISAILVLFYKDTAIYLHGASDHQYRKFMAPYLLQWQAIRDAKKRGCETYDFWGVAPVEKSPNSKIQISKKLEIENWKLEIPEGHPWTGITRFKMGFSQNGQILHYPPAYDLIFRDFWYKLYKLAKG